MIQPRVIPSLLISNGELIKTQQFSSPKYVGDPINAVKIFNEKEVDEILISDISASVSKRGPDMSLIKKLASECRMPMAYSGGITKPEMVEEIISLGVEKVGISSGIFKNQDLIKKSVSIVGSQSVVAILDIKKSLFKGYQVYCFNGKKLMSSSLSEVMNHIQTQGVGEIIINDIDRDGMMRGYNHDLIEKVKDSCVVPLTILGGAGTIDDLSLAIKKFGLIGCGAGSMFVFHGKYRAVLISYINREEKIGLLSSFVQN